MAGVLNDYAWHNSQESEQRFRRVLHICQPAGIPSPPSDSPDVPDGAMMAPVTALARYMAHVDGAVLAPVFADGGLVIVENFPPYIFDGKDAAAHWARVTGSMSHGLPN